MKKYSVYVHLEDGNVYTGQADYPGLDTVMSELNNSNGKFIRICDGIFRKEEILRVISEETNKIVEVIE